MDILEFEQSSTPTRRRSSIFKIEAEVSHVPETREEVIYRNQMTRELEQWRSLLVDKRKTLIEKHNERKTLDMNILSKEQLDYISKAPDIKQILEEAENYVRKSQFVQMKAAGTNEKTEETVKGLRSIIEEKAVSLMNQLIFD